MENRQGKLCVLRVLSGEIFSDYLMSHIWVDRNGLGQMLPADAPAIGVEDRGFAYGDGLFETMRVRVGRPLFLARHLRRLRAGLERLAFPPLTWDDSTLAERCQQMIAHNAVSQGVLKVIVTRGAGPRGFAPPIEAHPTLIVQVNPLSTASPSVGVSAILAPWTVDPASPLCYVKHLSALDKVMAREHARRSGADEALFHNMRGQLTESDSSNLFLVIGGQVVTPALHCGLLPGIIRGLLIETAPVAIVETEVPLAALAEASEAFLTNAIGGVRPLLRVADRVIGKGEPGPITAMIAAHYQTLLDEATHA